MYEFNFHNSIISNIITGLFIIQQLFSKYLKMQIPKTILYSNEHLWTKASTNGTWEAGITDYAQDLLGDIVFIEAPAIGTKLIAGQPCGLVESVKTGSDLHALVDGEVIETNQDLLTSPELVNEKPYQAWIFKYKPNDDDVSKTLLSAEAYQALLDGTV